MMRFSGKSPLSLEINGSGEGHGEDGGNPAQTPSRRSAARVPAKFCMALPERWTQRGGGTKDTFEQP